MATAQRLQPSKHIPNLSSVYFKFTVISEQDLVTKIPVRTKYSSDRFFLKAKESYIGSGTSLHEAGMLKEVERGTISFTSLDLAAVEKLIGKQNLATRSAFYPVPKGPIFDAAPAAEELKAEVLPATPVPTVTVDEEPKTENPNEDDLVVVESEDSGKLAPAPEVQAPVPEPTPIIDIHSPVVPAPVVPVALPETPSNGVDANSGQARMRNRPRKR